MYLQLTFARRNHVRMEENVISTLMKTGSIVSVRDGIEEKRVRWV